LAIFEQALGPEHPSLAFTLNGMGSVLVDLGRSDEAMASIRRALAIREKALCANHPLVADELSLVGEVWRKTHRLREACAAFDHAVGILDPVDAEHPRFVRALVGRATCRVDRGDAGGAIADTDRAIALAGRSHTSPWYIGWARFIQAQALWLRPADRQRSVEVAHTARAGYDGAPARYRTEVDEIDAWLKTHRVP
jgi:tetratricopeptide (TPR) repeat protein